MRSLAAVLGFVLSAAPLYAQTGANPHGPLPKGMDCADCHSPDRWTPVRKDARFDHSKTTFALTNKHSAVACNSCHTTLRFAAQGVRARECASCHTDVHESRFGKDCASCHDARSFTSPPGPQAHARSNLPLTGAHASVPCESCHRDASSGSFTALDARCSSCHQADYDRTTLPDHAAANFPQDCTQCHSSLAWQGARFDHTSFQLTGAHLTASCTACHARGTHELVFPRPTTEQDCIACHRADYDDEHAGSAYPTTCLTCHRSTNSWDDADFEHTTVSSFALLGAHIRATCGSCHTASGGGLRFDPKPSSPQECAVCHNPDYEREHTGSGYPMVCITCHNPDKWSDAVFRHDLPVLDCVSCHQPDYTRAHNGSGYSTTCRMCHSSTTSWLGATVAHDKFPLTGAHTPLACTACHVSPSNALIYPAPSSPTDCVACHKADYDRQHTGSGFSTNCTSCHVNTTWTGATFDHAAVARGYVLLGRHAQIPCSSCHAPSGQPLFSPAGNQDCVACHRADYDREHTGSGFPTTCASCHTNDTWISSFNHDALFPIYSGKHAAAWSTCQQCHTSATDFRIFSCTNCHAQSKMDPSHSQVTGYAYDSVRCYSCHPRGD